MLYFHKASAGSGKTYKLTEKFIRLLLSYPNGDDHTKRVLIPAEKFIANHPKVLAITFTNKAAQEMKDRIISALSKLGYDSPGTDTVYLTTFMEEFGASELSIRATARRALDELLNNYTDFNVSTIDAFFQRVLRSFAYETDLTNNFRLEVKNDVVNAIAVDTTLMNHKASGGKDGMYKWISEDILRNASLGSSYNVYSDKSSFLKNIYSFLRLTGSEGFSENEVQMKEHFSEHENFAEEYYELFRKIGTLLLKMLAEVKKKAKEIGETLERLGGNRDKYIAKNFINYLSALQNLTVGKEYTNKIYTDTKIFKKGYEKLGEGTTGNILSMAENLGEILEGYHSILALRKLYHEFMPAMAIYGSIEENRRNYCEENNIFLLSDTNRLLDGLIKNNETDAPFIYEKIGSYIEHFLIDEFQDTSRKQWDIIRPLFSESLAQGEFNMIIGDAKQSIYRFRNADPTIISQQVPTQFGSRIEPHGYDADNSEETAYNENSNFRSFPRIVEFNNTLFSLISRERSYESDYQGVAQCPRSGKRGGYVECRFYDTEEKEERFSRVVEIIEDLLKRGYQQRDIVVLSRYNHHLQQTIEEIKENNFKNAGGEQIRFISNESLLVNSAESVRMAVSVLRLLVSGNTFDVAHSGERRILKLTGPMLSSMVNYALISDEKVRSLQDALRAVADINKPQKELSEMLGNMSAMTLPALVENILKHFVAEERLSAESQYVAAFMDKVVEWSENYGSSISPFLRNWDEISSKLSVIAPDKADAVKLMTIHKSKGLEFKVVIFPTYDMKDEFSASKSPKCWVSPLKEYDENDVLPPKMLVTLYNDKFYPEEFNTALDELKSDNINLTYVACTRAVEELYVVSEHKFTQKKGKKNDEEAANSDIGSQILDVLKQIDDGAEIERFGIDHNQFHKVGLNEEDEEDLSGGVIFAYGEKREKIGEGESEESDNKKEWSSESMDITRYVINNTLRILKYQPEELRAEDSEDEDPRSIGNLMHLVMSRIFQPSDLEKAVRILSARGLASENVVSDIKEKISAALESEEGKKWFSPRLRVINERTIIGSGRKYLRPDRVIVDSEGNATVIDFKFGMKDGVKEYEKQVEEYVEILRKTGSFRSVSGYLWYVNLGKSVRIS